MQYFISICFCAVLFSSMIGVSFAEEKKEITQKTKDSDGLPEEISRTNAIISIANLRRNPSSTKTAFDTLQATGSVTIDFLLPSTNVMATTLEDIDKDSSAESVKNVLQDMIQSSLRKERIRFEIAGLDIKKGYLEISNGKSIMRLLPDDFIRSQPRDTLPPKKLKFRSELKAHFVATSKILSLSLNNTEDTTTGKTASSQYRIISFPVVSKKGQSIASIGFRISDDFDGSIGHLKDISSSFF